ncbi:hypothetical protein CPJCM30710_29790 [Clostridium polyendosporum]|uniref:DUF3892 domain-containing protein n=1 Tax=Clostridium polyendosporum TaxID=69208 RepID=A0A919S324_9CLOT|nr:DUF3892 domain-containing protein [Clostridium polyendosporum]GIM30313.1 hypothetical protein CPJCM30710_29790 [Clostridium polyendosporum]
MDNCGEYTVVAVKKGSNDEIIGYELETGEVISKDDAVYLAKEGRLLGAQVSRSEKSGEYIISLHEDVKYDTIDNLPRK